MAGPTVITPLFFVSETVMLKTDGRIFEYACHEGNYSMTGVLRGARLAEKGQERR